MLKDHNQDKDEMAFMSNTNEDYRGRENTLPQETTAHFTDGNADSVADSGAIRQGLYGTQVEEQLAGAPPQRYEDVFRIGQRGLILPFEKLDEIDGLKSIDLTYYQTKCREVLK